MASLKWSIVFAFAALIASEAIAEDVKCPEGMQVMESFEPQKYMGIWYEHQRYPFAFEVLSRCVSAKYEMNPDGTISVSNKAFDIMINNWNEVKGTAKVVAPGKLQIKFERGMIKVPADYWILGTDYTSFAVVYHCNENFKFIKGQKVWILTREMKPSQEVIDKAYQIMDSHNLDRDLLQNSYKTNCPKRTLFNN